MSEDSVGLRATDHGPRPMLSPRNLHFALLGVILGAAAGYIFGQYKAQARIAPPSVSAPAGDEGFPDSGSGKLPPDHPDVTDEQMLAMFKEAIQKNPNNAELLVKYANFLYDAAKFSEAITWYEKALEIEPKNVDVRSDMGTALWNIGKTEEALAQYDQSLALDPKHMLTLHNLFVVTIEAKNDLAKADSILQQMAQIDPNYESLPALRKKLEDSRKRIGRSR